MFSCSCISYVILLKFHLFLSFSKLPHTRVTFQMFKVTNEIKIRYHLMICVVVFLTHYAHIIELLNPQFWFQIFFFFFFFIQDRILLQPNLSVYVCETPSWRFESRPLPPTPYKHIYLWSDHRTKGVRWLVLDILLTLQFRNP